MGRALQHAHSPDTPTIAAADSYLPVFHDAGACVSEMPSCLSCAPGSVSTQGCPSKMEPFGAHREMLLVALGTLCPSDDRQTHKQHKGNSQSLILFLSPIPELAIQGEGACASLLAAGSVLHA